MPLTMTIPDPDPDTDLQPPTWFGDYLRSLSDEDLFRLLYDGMRPAEFRHLLSTARRTMLREQGRDR